MGDWRIQLVVLAHTTVLQFLHWKNENSVSPTKEIKHIARIDNRKSNSSREDIKEKLQLTVSSIFKDGAVLQALMTVLHVSRKKNADAFNKGDTNTKLPVLNHDDELSGMLAPSVSEEGCEWVTIRS